MATVAYRPELENPSREGSLSFAVKQEGQLMMKTLTLEPGVNRKVDDSSWEALKAVESVKALIKIGAIEEIEQRKGGNAEAQGDVQKNPELDDVLGMSVVNTLKVIEGSFDEKFLQTWKKAENRQTVINSIAKRLLALKAGEG